MSQVIGEFKVMDTDGHEMFHVSSDAVVSIGASGIRGSLRASDPEGAYYLVVQPRMALFYDSNGGLAANVNAASHGLYLYDIEEKPTVEIDGTRGDIHARSLQLEGRAVVDGITFADDTVQTTACGSSASVPIGTVIDWWRPNTGFPVPDGYLICDGSFVDDPQSPFHGERLPNLRGMYVRGAGGESAIGMSGGSDRHTHAVTGSTTPAAPTTKRSNKNMMASLVGPPLHEFGTGSHDHDTNPHDHGAGALDNSTQAHEPPYVQLLKIMRVR